MISTAQLLNYYPKYSYLDDVVSLSGRSNLNLFIDLKGCLQSIYQEWAVRYILNESVGSYIDHSIFSSVLEFISWHRKYEKSRNVNVKIFIFFETGSSIYHNRILSTYKDNRIDNTSGKERFFGLGEFNEEEFLKIINRNFDVIEKVCSRLPNVYCIRLQNIEADFIPYYIRKFILKDDNSTDIIYSLDKDMIQCLLTENIYMFYRHHTKKSMIDKNKMWDHLFKCETNLTIGAEYLPLMLSIMSDSSDNYFGPYTVKKNRKQGIGKKTLLKLLPSIINSISNMNTVYNNIENNVSIFNNKCYDDSLTKPMKSKLDLIYDNEDIIVRNLKLASYELLSRWVNENYPLEKVKLMQKIYDSVKDENKIKSGRVLYAALNKAGLTNTIQEKTIYNLFM